MKNIKYYLLGILIFVVLFFGLNYLNIFQISFFGTKTENAQRKVFENTQSYVEGKRQELLKDYKEYQQADSSGKAALKSIISMSFANFDDNKIQEYKLRQFLKEMKYH